MFTKIDSILWTDSKYKKLSDNGKFLFIYVLSCPHRNILGFYFLPIPYCAFDLGWSSERVSKGLGELFDKGFINYNEETNMIFIKNFLKYNPLENPNQVKGAIKVLDSLPSGSIDIEFIELIKSINETLSKPLLEPLLKGLGKRLAKQEEVYVEEEVEEDVDEEEPEPEQKPEDEKTPSPINKDNEDFKKIANLYQQVIGQPNGLTSDWIEDILKEYGFEWLSNSMKEADKRGKRSKKYIEAILSNWKTEGGMRLDSDKKENKPYTKGKPLKTRFHNFEGRSDKYSNDELEDKMEKKRQEARDRMKDIGSSIGIDIGGSLNGD